MHRYLTKTFHRMTRSGFKFHRDCEGLNLSHLCFADDLFVFANGDANSIEKISKALKHFQEVSNAKSSKEFMSVFLNS